MQYWVGFTKKTTISLNKIKQMIRNILHFFEKNGFFVASRLADRLGMKATSVRLFFIISHS